MLTSFRATTPLEAASSPLRKGVTGLDVSGQRKTTVDGTSLARDSLLVQVHHKIPDTCTRLRDTSYSENLRRGSGREKSEFSKTLTIQPATSCQYTVDLVIPTITNLHSIPSGHVKSAQVVSSFCTNT